MRHTFKNILPIVGFLSILVGVAVVVMLNHEKRKMSDRSIDRPELSEAMMPMESLGARSLADPSYLQSVSDLLKRSHVVSVWLIDSNGIILLSKGCLARSTPENANVSDLANRDTRNALMAMPENFLNSEERLFLLSESAMRREGEHNDIYHRMLRPVRSSDGVWAGIIGIVYEVSDWTPGLLWKTGVLLLPLCFLIYWFSFPLWVFLDAQERGENRWVWGSFVFMGNLIALMAYILSRPRRATELRKTTPSGSEPRM
jgi:hypothetical protein